MPGGCTIAELFCYPSWLMHSRVPRIRQNATSPLLTQEILPFQYSEFFLLGVAPTYTSNTSPFRAVPQLSGSCIRFSSSGVSYASCLGTPRVRPRCCSSRRRRRAARTLVSSCDADSTPGCLSRQLAVRSPEQAAASTDCRKRLMIAGTFASVSRAAFTRIKSDSIFSTIRACSAAGARCNGISFALDPPPRTDAETLARTQRTPPVLHHHRRNS